MTVLLRLLGTFLRDCAAAVFAVLRGMHGDPLAIRAGFLTYLSLFAVVPLVTVALALFQLVGQPILQRQLIGFVESLLAPGVREESAAVIQHFLDKASSTAAGGLSVLVLSATAVTFLRHLDEALNELWAAHRRRPLWMRVAAYGTLLIIGPLLLGITLAGTASVNRWLEHTPVPFSRPALLVLSLCASVGVLTVLYRLVPTVPVRWRSAFLGGLVTGVAWQVARATYGVVAATAFRQNPIYGSLSAAPLFLVWMYLGWWLLLFGSRLTFAAEHLRQPSAQGVGSRAARLLATRLGGLLAQRGGAVSLREAARTLAVPAGRIADLLGPMESAGLVHFARGHIRLARPAETLSVADALVALEGSAPDENAPGLEGLLGTAERRMLEPLEQVSWASLPRTPTSGQNL